MENTELKKLLDELWPICRSLTGQGVRDSFDILKKHIPLLVHEVPSGKKCFDWTVPPEWNIKEAWIKNDKGEKIIDFTINNLHILGYSENVHAKLSLEELKPFLYSNKEYPDVIPYYTSYYKRRWGFCLSYNDYLNLKDCTYEVFIDSTLNDDGDLNYADIVLPGETDEEIFFSTYICHPSMANNELSGPIVSLLLYEKLARLEKRKYTYRWAFVPETIGSINYLSEHGELLKEKMKAGYVITCAGDRGIFTFKKSRRGNTIADKAAISVLQCSKQQFNLVDFFPDGSDERQYCSPGFNLPVGSLMRTMYMKFPEYHTSADNLEFISLDSLQESAQMYFEITQLIEQDGIYINTNPFCEPQLGKRGLYPSLGSQTSNLKIVDSLMWLLNMCDGENSLIDIAFKSKQELSFLYQALNAAIENGLIVKKD